MASRLLHKALLGLVRSALLGLVRSMLLRLSTALLVCLAAMSANAAEQGQPLEINRARALFNYQIFCQGCHTANGAGAKSVPNLNDNLGYFLRSQVGREYIVRVPGSANSVLDKNELAEVLNWMLSEFAGDSLNDDWRPFDAEEVELYRQEPLFEVLDYRRQLLADLLPES